MKKATDRSAGEEDVLARETFRSYRKLWWYSVSLTALVSILPLVLMTGLNHRLYWQTLKAEMAHPISNLTSNARMAIEDFIEKHLSALTFLANDRSCDDLGDAQRLGATFATIKASFHGFVDLGVLDAQGKQARYVGPYDLAGND
ncbi:MAG: hypothetical protein HY814_00905, partial [Candidatus Riflebacteria bacterium]|nr:hypothetical protein [Candidatus Riflebacteria bacterium]